MRYRSYEERPPEVATPVPDDGIADDTPGITRRDRSVYDETAAVYRDPVAGVAADEVIAERRSGSWYLASPAARLNSALFAVFAVLEGLLIVRFALRAFGANARSSFVDFVYDVSWPFVRPFNNAFRNHTWDQGIIEPSTALAIGVYLLAMLSRFRWQPLVQEGAHAVTEVFYPLSEVPTFKKTVR